MILTTENKTLNITEIKRLLPHRYPFLFIDRVTDYQEGKYLVGLKNVSVNEPQFTGHFPQLPIFPGVLFLKQWLKQQGCWHLNRLVLQQKMSCTTSRVLIMLNS